MTKCSVCGVKEAVFYKRDSGEVVCSRCLEKGLVKKVRRIIARNSMLKPEDNIAYIIIPWRPYTSTAALKVLEIVEDKFKTNIAVYVPKGIVDVEKAKRLFKMDFIEFEFHLEDNSNFKSAERTLMEKLLTTIGENYKVVLPYTMEDQAVHFLYGLFKIDLEVIAFSKPIYEGYRSIIKPFYQVPSEELNMYSYVKGLREPVIRSVELNVDETLSHVYKILEHMIEHYELMYSTIYMAHTMANELKLKQCKICGLPSLGDYCSLHLNI